MTEQQCEQQIKFFLQQDALRFGALKTVAELNLPQCYLSAGFVRNLVWDQLHTDGVVHPLNDIDVIYYDAAQTDPQRDTELERQLCARSALPWSVKNQARMHLRNEDAPYQSTHDAIRYWPETETAVAARWNASSEQIEIISGFGLQCLFAATITINPQRPKPEAFMHRVTGRNWLSQWPALKIIN